MSETNDPSTSDTRVAHQIIRNGVDALRALLEGADTARKVEVGTILCEIEVLTKEMLVGVKKDLRTQGVQVMGGVVGMTTLEGDDYGEATVTIPAAQLRLPKGADIEDLQRALGSKFSRFFEETVTHKPHTDFEERVEAVEDALTQKVLLDAIERNELTPRVAFRRNRPSNRDK